MSTGYGTVGKPVRLYDTFLEARRNVESRLRESGLSDRALQGWQSDHAGGIADLDIDLREAAGAGDATDELLREAGSTSDFGSYLADKATKRLMASYEDAPSSWRQYTRIYNVPDFKPISFVRLTEMDDLLPIPEGGPYPDSQIGEINGPQVTVGTFGREFSLSRRAIVNDDLNQLRDNPARMGRATARSIARDAVGLLERNPNAYDGTPVFSTTHKNLITGVISEDNVGKLVAGLRTQTDDNVNRLALRPRVLMVPAELELPAMRIVNSTAVPLAGYAPASPATTPAQHGMGGANVIGAVVRDITVEDYLTDPSDYYITADPQIAPGLAVGFLNGKQTPDIFLRDPGMRNVLGTSDPYSMHYDEIFWKVRHDWGTVILDWRGLQKSAN